MDSMTLASTLNEGMGSPKLQQKTEQTIFYSSLLIRGVQGKRSTEMVCQSYLTRSMLSIHWLFMGNNLLSWSYKFGWKKRQLLYWLFCLQNTFELVSEARTQSGRLVWDWEGGGRSGNERSEGNWKRTHVCSFREQGRRPIMGLNQQGRPWWCCRHMKAKIRKRSKATADSEQCCT